MEFALLTPPLPNYQIFHKFSFFFLNECFPIRVHCNLILHQTSNEISQSFRAYLLIYPCSCSFPNLLRPFPRRFCSPSDICPCTQPHPPPFCRFCNPSEKLTEMTIDFTQTLSDTQPRLWPDFYWTLKPQRCKGNSKCQGIKVQHFSPTSLRLPVIWRYILHTWHNHHSSGQFCNTRISRRSCSTHHSSGHWPSPRPGPPGVQRSAIVCSYCNKIVNFLLN